MSPIWHRARTGRPLEWAALVEEAVRALAVHRLRTALSIVGVVGAVAAIVCSAAIVQGGRHEAMALVGALGERNVIIRGAPGAAGSETAATMSTISVSDIRSIGQRVPGVAAIAAARSSRLELVVEGSRTVGTVVGVTENWPRVSEVRVAIGRWLTPQDVFHRTRVMVLGATAAGRLSGGSPVVGRPVKAGDDWFTVIGVLEPRSRGAGSMQRFDVDEAAMVPFSTADRRRGPQDGPDRAEEIVMAFASGSLAARGAPRFAELIRALPPGDALRSVEVLVPREILRARLATRRSFDVMLLGVGVVALIISGVAIMNIMLVSVSERAPEIGTRRACGARRSDILRQFTLEAGMLTAAGALAGTITGLTVTAALAWIGWPVYVSGMSLAVSWVLVSVTGLSCGLYPAYRAAALSPATALRGA